jgi:hypothetical protein
MGISLTRPSTLARFGLKVSASGAADYATHIGDAYAYTVNALTVDYWHLRATMGSTRMARRAGI